MTGVGLVGGYQVGGAPASSFTTGVGLTFRQIIRSAAVDPRLNVRQKVRLPMLTTVALTIRQTIELKSSVSTANAKGLILRQIVRHLSHDTQLTLRQDIEDV